MKSLQLLVYWAKRSRFHMLFGDEFKRLATLSFRQDSQGREVFHLFWTRGSGRVLPDAAFADKMRKRMMWSSRLLALTVAVLTIALVSLFDTPTPIVIGEAIAGCVVALGCQWLYLYWHVRNLPSSTERLERVGYWEGQRRYWRTCSTQSLIAPAACCAVGLFFSLSSLRTDPPGERWNDIPFVIACAIGFTLSLPGPVWKLRQTKSGRGSI